MEVYVKTEPTGIVDVILKDAIMRSKETEGTGSGNNPGGSTGGNADGPDAGLGGKEQGSKKRNGKDDLSK